jgi:hypothetical protein
MVKRFDPFDECLGETGYDILKYKLLNFFKINIKHIN